MPYLGNIPSTVFSGLSYQDLTGGTGTSFTLDYSVSSAQDIEVFVNNVRQEPGVAYTTAGTTLTMTGSIAATDDFYVVFQAKTFGTVSHPAGNSLQATTGTFSGNVTSSGTITATLFSGDGSALTGISSNAGIEYFEVDLTSDMTGLTDATSTVVDFGGSGTVVYDTASNFDSANDAYLLDSSNGVYLISFNCALRSTTLGNTTGDLIQGIAGIEIATDGSTYSGYKAEAQTPRNNDTDSTQSITVSGSFIYKATTATTKIRMTAVCDMTGSDNWNIESTGAGMLQTAVTTNLNTAKVTWMSVMRIA